MLSCSPSNDIRRKMKIKSIVASIALIFGALTFASAPAYAGECSAEDPCHTYAMVDGSGLVTNIIVCQPSVCGSGTFAGSRVVLQVVANPETHLSQGGIFGGTDNIDKRVTESNGTFTITNNNPIVTQEVIKETPNSGTQLQSSIGSGTQQSFTVADTAHTVGVITLHDKPIDQNIGATLTASEVNIETSTVVVGTVETSTVIVETITPVITESITFTERKTEKEVEDALENSVILKRNMYWFKLSLLRWLL
jgi:hypothetical protein